MFAKVAGSTTEARCVRPAGSSDSTFGEGLLAFPRALDFSWGETEPAHSTYPHASPGGAVDHRTPLENPGFATSDIPPVVLPDHDRRMKAMGGPGLPHPHPMERASGA